MILEYIRLFFSQVQRTGVPRLFTMTRKNSTTHEGKRPLQCLQWALVSAQSGAAGPCRTCVRDAPPPGQSLSSASRVLAITRLPR